MFQVQYDNKVKQGPTNNTIAHNSIITLGKCIFKILLKKKFYTQVLQSTPPERIPVSLASDY